MRITVRVAFYFIRAWFVYVFTAKPKTRTQYYSHNLFQATFRIPQSKRNQFTLVPRKYIDLIRTLFFRKTDLSSAVILEDNRNGAFIYEVFKEEYAGRKKYTEYFAGKPVNGGVLKEDLYFGIPLLQALLLSFISTLFLPLFFLHSLFKKDKAPIAMLFKEMLETINLLKIAERYRMNELFFFCIFEIDANIATVLLQNAGVSVIKIPSEVPLAIWNKSLLRISSAFAAAISWMKWSN